ncbi:TonB-dependent siderophore receptor [Kushneria aurantia]|uniref:TonB-dependent siderophore receptor n=1 Tax=Kushneria aurantia TaxID=504092 RepID=A0ABV6G4R9_9GAMM|nr:TonB-dependent siderophore receptor [Kushneria aurantia]
MSCKAAITPPGAPRAPYRRCALALGSLFLLSPVPGWASQSEPAVEQADTVVVTDTALKVAAPVIETPRATSLVEQQALETRAVNKFDEALQYRAGVVSQPYGADNNTDWFFIRGFSAEDSLYLDGLRLFRTGGYFWWLTEPFGLERVEVLKGPASILYGEAPPGGIINAVSKRPGDETQGEVGIEVGNKDHRQLSIDTSGPVEGRDDMRYRMVGLYREGDGELNGTETERYYFAPSLSVDFSEETRVTFLASAMKDEGVPTIGFFPAFGTVEDTPFGTIDRDTNLGQPDYDHLDQRQYTLGYELEHQLDEAWSFEQNFRYSRLELDLRQVYPNAFVTPPRSISRGVVDRDGDYNAFTLDNRLIARTFTDRIENTLLLGVGYQHLDLEYANADSFRTLGDGSSYFTSIDNVDIFAPDHDNFTPPDTGDPTRHDVDRDQAGFYAQNQLRLDDRWIFLAGWRYDTVDSSDDFSDATGSASQGYDDSQMSITGGVMYLADNGLSPYLSYSESFTPVSGTGPDGDSYRPLSGQQWEVGVKYTPMNFDGYVTLAAFDITEDNTLISTGAPVQEQAGERHSRGVEVEAVGYLTDSLQLTAAYTYTDARADISDGLQDERVPFVPYHMASTRLDYAFTGALDGLSLGGGLRYMGETVNSANASTRYRISPTTLVDAMARYDFADNWRVQLNARNLTDEDYVSGCDFYCYYGASRSLTGSLKYRW